MWTTFTHTLVIITHYIIGAAKVENNPGTLPEHVPVGKWRVAVKGVFVEAPDMTVTQKHVVE